jgi:hypothetical protein
LILYMACGDSRVTTGTLKGDADDLHGIFFVNCLITFQVLGAFLVTSMTLWMQVKKEEGICGLIS